MVLEESGEYRPCGDYRKFNNQTIQDRYSVPHIQEFSINLRNTIIFSKMDLAKGYHQVPINPSDIPKTAVITPFGLFEYIKIPFGLRSSAQIFQRMMDNIGKQRKSRCLSEKIRRNKLPKHPQSLPHQEFRPSLPQHAHRRRRELYILHQS